MPTTEELFTRLGAVLDHGPVSGSSLQYAIATLDTLAQRTRDLAGEVERLRRIADAALDVIFGMHVSVDTTHVRVARNRMDALRAALAPAEAGSGLGFEGSKDPPMPPRPDWSIHAAQSIVDAHEEIEDDNETLAFIADGILHAYDHRTPEPAEAGDGGRLVTVCDKCLQASCWQGVFMCEKRRTGGTVEKPISELQFMALESPHYWKPDA